MTKRRVDWFTAAISLHLTGYHLYLTAQNFKNIKVSAWPYNKSYTHSSYIQEDDSMYVRSMILTFISSEKQNQNNKSTAANAVLKGFNCNSFVNNTVFFFLGFRTSIPDFSVQWRIAAHASVCFYLWIRLIWEGKLYIQQRLVFWTLYIFLLRSNVLYFYFFMEMMPNVVAVEARKSKTKPNSTPNIFCSSIFDLGASSFAKTHIICWKPRSYSISNNTIRFWSALEWVFIEIWVVSTVGTYSFLGWCIYV